MPRSDVPFLDLTAQYRTIRAGIDAAVDAVHESGAYAGGPFVERFEQEFAAYCGVNHAVGVGSGTDALWATLIALGIGPGDEVITAPNTFIATAEAISFCGATPVLVDIDPTTYNLDPGLLARAITPRTRAVIPVHLYGRMAEMDPIMATARDAGLRVIEDASQAHGAEYRGRRAGSIGDAGCFSFYPGKNLGAYGEAGVVTTNDDALAARLRVFRNHGQERRNSHVSVGFNARMDGIQGAVLSVKLPHLPAWNAARRRHAAAYTASLQHFPAIVTPRDDDRSCAVYHVYAVLVGDRDRVLDAMQQQGVQCLVHYPRPLHLHVAYRSLGYREGAFPVAEAFASQTLSLPIFPELTESQRDRVVHALMTAVRSMSAG